MYCIYYDYYKFSELYESYLELYHKTPIRANKLIYSILPKGIYNEEILNFISFCSPYYFLSKRKYLEKKLTINTFTTILRQICNFNKITYTSQIKYNKSTYTIEYYIYY